LSLLLLLLLLLLMQMTMHYMSVKNELQMWKTVT